MAPGSRKLILGGTGFLLLTAGVFWYQFSRLGSGAATPRWEDLQWRYLALIVLCLPLESLACGIRIWVITRVLDPHVRLETCIRAEWAQVAVSILTPTQSGGGPGQIYIMRREGASLGTAVTVMVLSCLGTMVALLGVGVYSMLVAGIDGSRQVFLTAMWTFCGISAVVVVAAVWPGLFRVALGTGSRAFWRLARRPRALYDWWPPGQIASGPAPERMGRLAGKLVEITYSFRDDVGRFLHGGKTAWAWVCALSLVFLLSRATISYLCVRSLGIEASTFHRIVEAQIVLLLVEFVAPSPGGAGLVEGASLTLMGDVVPSGFAPHYNLLWRLSTLYLPALAGFVCLGRAAYLDARRVSRSTQDRRFWTKPLDAVVGKGLS